MAERLSFLGKIKAQFSTKALVLIPIAAGINIIGGTLCSMLKLPLFLDMIGTIVVACLSGPWVAALTGLLTNVFLAIVANPVNLAYAVVSALCGLVVGYMAKAGLLTTWWGAVTVWLVTTLTNAFSAGLITTFVFGGATGVNGTSVLTAAFAVTMRNILLSVFSSALIENLIDKGIAVFIAYFMIGKIPKRFLSQYAQYETDCDVADDETYGDSVVSVGTDSPRRDLNSKGSSNADVSIKATMGHGNGIRVTKHTDNTISGNARTVVLDMARNEDKNMVSPKRERHDWAESEDNHDEDQDFVRGLNPLTKIVAVFSFGFSAILWPDPRMGVALLFILLVVSRIAHMTSSFVKLMAGFGAPITVMLMFMQGFYGPRNKTFIADFGFAKLGLEGVMYAGKVVVVVLVFLGGFYIMTASTDTGKMVAAFSEVGLPAKMAYLVLASLKIVPQMQRRMAVVKGAQSARGLKVKRGLPGRLKAIIPLLGPVVLSSMTDAQERGMTLETRGFGRKGVTRTSLVQVRWSVADRWATTILVVSLLLTAAVSISARLGILTYWRGV